MPTEREHTELLTLKDVRELREIVERTIVQFNGQTSLDEVVTDGTALLIIFINDKLRSVQ